ncbi:X-ray radiation resistance-associated protein 1 isoform X2 [Papio anubis]|uniref:X-ray radiation resistance-associated protein 1-like isoform X2 n=1 Tax=Papio anubis TaxID=9555 RepID=UPI0012AE355B|nr:X-ray radiation resistance-associated protein 1-like isoform X2 [Papio anubis]XP_031517258.1 X-ray radiation resistance-associated protein 1 isoform X2 [Papio anubis]
MASSGIYKLDDGKPYLNNCFPARNLLRVPEEGQGHWLVVQKGNLKKKPRGLVGAQAERRESLKVTSFEFRGKKGSRRENQVDLPGRILDQAFLAKENDFKHFHSVIYINASENLLPLEAFHTFPALKELDLAFNGIKTIYVKYGDFKLLEVSWSHAFSAHVLIVQVDYFFSFHEDLWVTFYKGTKLCHYLRVTAYVDSKGQQSWSHVWGWASGHAHSLSNRLFSTCWSRSVSESNLSKMSAHHEP